MAKRVLSENLLLQTLPPAERDLLARKMRPVMLPLHSVLNEESQTIKFGYFLTAGLASILTVLKHNKVVEVGLTGREGFIGLPLIAGLRTSATRVIVQVQGRALRISARNLRTVLPSCPVLQTALLRIQQELFVQSAQIAACNRLHDANQRLARWILMSLDRVGGSDVHLTQEFLAHMLGMRRASVTVAIGFLQEKGLIKYTRGTLQVLNRGKLEAETCECYQAIVRHQYRWRKESASASI